MSFSKVSSKIASNNLVLNSLQKSSAIGTFPQMQNGATSTMSSPWGSKDIYPSKDNKDFRPMSTVSYAKKLQAEEDLRAQIKPFQVHISQILRPVPKKSSKAIWNDL